MNILAIDDEILTQEFIQEVLKNEHTSLIASNGEEGIKLAIENNPDLIILDVNMPGMDGYEVCKKLKSEPVTSEIPVLFLSAHNDLNEQMKGYQVGGDDYLVKPCEPKTLRAKVNVMLRYKAEREKLNAQFHDAEKTAHIAMIGNSEIGMGLHLIQQSFLINNYEDLARAIFSFTDQLKLSCALMFFTDDGPRSFCSESTCSPLEAELLEKMRDQKRIFDFQQRTFVNYPNVTLLVKNMPVHDSDRSGHLKDLLPTILGAINNKLMTMRASTLIESQADELKLAFDNIQTSLLKLTNSLGDAANKSNALMRQLYSDMQDFLPKLALDEDQETFILDHIEKTSIESNVLNKSTSEMGTTLLSVVNTLKFVIDKQQNLANDLKSDDKEQTNDGGSDKAAGDIDYF